MVLVAVLARRADNFGQRYQGDEKDSEGPLDAHHLVEVRSSAFRAIQRKPTDSARAFTHSK